MLKEINRIWMGSPIPEKFAAYGQAWLDLNPGYTLHDWTEEEILDTQWTNQAVIDHMRHESRQPGADMVAFYTHVADVVDYELVNTGGWYFNTDLKPVQPLSVLHERFDLSLPALAMEDDKWPVNMAMYSPTAGNKFFEAVIKRLPRRYFNNPGAFMNYTTGVYLLDDVLGAGYRVTKFPRKVFNPLHFTDFGYGEEPDLDAVQLTDETVAIHAWGHRTNQRNQRVLES